MASLAEEMALAVLRGDDAAAAALADHYCERRASGEILSLPLYPELSDEAARRVVSAVRTAAREC